MPEPIIRLEHADIFQRNRQLVLHDVSLSMFPGEFVYLIGRTGSGKSSLLKTLYGELPLTVGSGSMDGVSLQKLPRKKLPDLRRKLGIVFQDFQLLSDRNVLDNLLFVLRATDWKDKKKMEKRAREVLELVGLPTKDYKFPHELSGGEQQRVVIARALLNDPKIILADEPTGNLDPDVSDDIMKLLHDICKQGTAILMATHDYRLINKFPGIVWRCSAQSIRVDDKFLG
ncbi:MAG: ATP-binding cassette domain-containing protein [Flavobacteriales bacterium]|nr:ATP-binding cassette domain-containing protein [Flavobacteriales bacterium]